MKTKIWMLLMALGMLFAIPSLSYAQYTDEDIEFEAGDSNNSDFGPISFDPVLVKGVLSHNNKTITNTFLFDLGDVTVQIVDKSGNVYIEEEVNTSENAVLVIDIKNLPAQTYKIICFTKEGLQTATFSLHHKLN